MNIKIKKNERIDDLEIKNMKIIQNKEGFCFGIDSVLLSEFAKEIKEKSKCIDLGTGTGILGILLCAKTELAKIIGVEIQEEVAEMARRSIQLNQLEDRFEVLNIDLRQIIDKNKIQKLNLEDKITKNSFDYVIMNPPYKKLNTGKTNDIEKKLISRHEITANLEDFIKIARYLLKDKGSIYMVHRADRLIDIIKIMREEKIEPKRIRMVHSTIEKEANLVLIKGTKNGGQFLRVEKPLIIYNKHQQYTEEVLKIYNKI